MDKQIRKTFGIIDPVTKVAYADMIDFKIGARYFHASHLLFKTITCPIGYPEDWGIVYKLHMDTKLKNALKALPYGNYLKVIISYQNRTTGDIALARVYNPDKHQQLSTNLIRGD